MDISMTELEQIGARAKAAARVLAAAGTRQKNQAIEQIIRTLENNRDQITAANQKDIEAAREAGISEALIDRLTLTPARIGGMLTGAGQVIALDDPVGEVIEGARRPNGLSVTKVRVPMGVVGIIYESRPNVTVDAAVLTIKSGNAVILKGGKEAAHSNRILGDLMAQALTETGLPADCVQVLDRADRETTAQLMRMNQYIDVLIPRGSGRLIRAVIENATVPVIQTGEGNCHVYVDASANLAMAQAITVNAKTSRPSVCNAIETVLVHKDVAAQLLPPLAKELREHKVELRADERARAIIGDCAVPATEEDWATEFLDYILAVRVVDSLEDAVAHINTYGTGHSECIVTKDYGCANAFLDTVDAAAVYVNASTRFTDGFELGLGAEIGISTQKLHARGPMGLRELTTCKYRILGDGQIR